jgi:hypothetical protein
MNVIDDVTGFGTTASAGALSFAVWPSSSPERFVTLLEDDSPLSLDMEADATELRFTIGDGAPDVILRSRLEVAPTALTVDGLALTLHADRASFEAAASGAYFDAASRLLWIRVPSASGERVLIVTKG